VDEAALIQHVEEGGFMLRQELGSAVFAPRLTGLRYDAIEKQLTIDSKIGNDFKCFIATETGFGLAGLRKGKPFIDVKYGFIDVKSVNLSGMLLSGQDISVEE
jgi:hypothetical protein